MSDIQHYILDGHLPVPAPLEEWADWFEHHQSDRIVHQTNVGEAQVSTVFLGLDFSFIPGTRRQIFETMVFGGRRDGLCRRYATWDEAEAGHVLTVSEEVKDE